MAEICGLSKSDPVRHSEMFHEWDLSKKKVGVILKDKREEIIISVHIIRLKSKWIISRADLLAFVIRHIRNKIMYRRPERLCLLIVRVLMLLKTDFAYTVVCNIGNI